MSALPRLHAVTDDAVLARPDFPDTARAVLAAGEGRVAVHLRGRSTPAARLHALALELRAVVQVAGGLLLANERVDLARAAALDGVHLPADGLPPGIARELLPPGSWVGVSVHDVGGARAAAPDADYLMVGTVFATPSHPGRTGAGPGVVGRVQAAASLPLIAIGGITPRRVPEVMGVGAQGVAALSGIWAAADPGAAVAEYLSALPSGVAAAAPRLRESGAGERVVEE